MDIQSSRSLAGRVAVITGGAQGIGRAIGERFAAEGATVVLADLAVDRAASAAAEIERTHGRPAFAVRMDVADPASVEQAADEVRARAGHPDVLVANAGTLLLKPVLDISLDEWRRVLDVNLTGAFVTARAFAARMVERGAGGRIIFSSSLFGRRGGRENGAYSASKFGVIGLMESMAAELAPHGVLVNAVCPGQVATEMIDRLVGERAALTGADAETVRSEMVARIPVGRLGSVEEIADVYVYLAGELSRYVTGQSLIVDGGWTVG
ncbi:sorbitol 6-phosphate dehydrogenase [Sphaerisporangium krabiense]|uniref:NAD(P)-dependent dehydrogenase (Short-subunit alcohol dehydrogenase family) n=1 Tax=Sphaerisporangium krabiense TaxID=763782 RepID=A0A7W8Z279_9ACTN|nr:SDR family NAD(P)-dependent oxidoreductase [Sphaerisporangium krabiense]MBB5626097.1 NAD(P)-dependent dehydrogenase (short-subunit alcohol dehydrogenase family) [Sphaerisporangium krabiense]GII64901.1 sorbitol 6-phosphate dehydrogenase [Sphaerisporangium krabiense]